MKNKLASDHDRATLGALFAIVGFTFIAVAVLPPGRKRKCGLALIEEVSYIFRPFS
jgi:hypothetical protein